ncbi:hypothetical protein GGI15_001279 [Coemansia interrupta]|uniref:C2 domain-containing protein n=1 Tax=Coemansia interrupta TaxID=1126814 RepID=A0A9W8HJV9_9FUNG|nr:hypothetical protein GGI15_001279 [Coemansia interrupta]
MASKKVEGKLDVQVVAGRELPRRSLFGRRDSAVDLKLGTVNKRTQIDKKGGASPQWNDRVSFTVSGLGKSQLQVTAIEIESTVSSKTIGTCVVDLAKVFVEEEVDGWYTLKHNDKPAGDVYLELTFTPKDGRKNIRKDPLADIDSPMFHTEPKLPRTNDTVASAPSLLQEPKLPPDTRPSPHLTPASLAAPIAMRPSMSDMRPYSSASMHNPELAIKYANKHGIKPLPPAPSSGMPMSMTESAVPMAAQNPMMGYDQTILPGQASYMNQHPIPPQQFNQTPNMGMSPAHQHQQQQQFQPQLQHQEPALMNLFAPPIYVDDGSAMSQPQAAMAPTPAYNPAYNPAVYSAEQSMAQSFQGKTLPLPPGQQMMVMDPNSMALQQQQQVMMMTPPMNTGGPAQMVAPGYVYSQGFAPEMMVAQQQYMVPQPFSDPMYAQQIPSSLPPQQHVVEGAQMQQQQQQPMVTYVSSGYQQGQQVIYDQHQQPYNIQYGAQVQPQQQQQQQVVYVGQGGMMVEPTAPMMNFDNSQPQYVHPQPQYAPGNPYGNQAY